MSSQPTLRHDLHVPQVIVVSLPTPDSTVDETLSRLTDARIS